MENNQENKRFERNSSERSREGRRPRIGSKPSGDGSSSFRSNATRPSFGERQSIRDERNGGSNRPRSNDNYERRNRPYPGGQEREVGSERNNRYERSNSNYDRTNGTGYHRSNNNEHNAYASERGSYERPQRNDRTDRPYNSERPRRFDNNRSGYNQQQSDREPSGSFQRKPREYNNNYRSQSSPSNFGKPFRKFESRSDSYDPNDKYSKRKQIEYKQQFVDLTKPMRLNKFMANAGICSRREADEFIQAGVVTVNGTPVTELGAKIIPATDKVLFHDQLVRSEKKVYILLNKPKDCVTTAEDTHARTTVLDLVKNACSERIYPVGRLDRNTTGVLLITNDGDLTSKLTHPKYDKKKIYHVILDRDLEQEDLDKLKSGIELEDGEIHADEINFVNEEDNKQVGIEIHSGKNRIVRRMFDHLGYRVVRLDRVYFAGLTKKNLPRGKWRFLSEAEVNMLKMSN